MENATNATNATNEKPSQFNVPKGHLFCNRCMSHHPKKTMFPGSEINVGMCKDEKACEQRKAEHQKAALKDKAKSAADKAQKAPRTGNSIHAPFQDDAQLQALPNTRFGIGDRQTIYNYIAANPNTTIKDIAKALNFTVAFVRSRVTCMVADLKIKPVTNAEHFTNKSTIKSVQDKLRQQAKAA